MTTSAAANDLPSPYHPIHILELEPSHQSSSARLWISVFQQGALRQIRHSVGTNPKQLEEGDLVPAEACHFTLYSCGRQIPWCSDERVADQLLRSDDLDFHME